MTLGPVMLDIAGTELTAEDRELIGHPSTGGVILFARNYESCDQLQRLVDAIHQIKKPPVLVAVDQEGGRVQRFVDPFVALPAARMIGRRYDMAPGEALALARDCGWLMASELRAVGIDLSFAPVVDLDWGVSTVIGNRSFHRRAETVAVLARAWVEGMAEAGMAATAKHFPGHGAVVADSHTTLPVDRRDPDQLKADLLPFRRLINAGLHAVMTAHVVYPEIDDVPASFSARWVNAILRRRFGFSGAVFCDDLSMAGAATMGTMIERADRALAAGCDMLPVCNDRPAAAELVDLLDKREDPMTQLRLLRLHGRGTTSLDALTATDRHRDVLASLDTLRDADELQLDA